MARCILLQDLQMTTGNIVHEASHDIELFIWVLLYCVMCNLYHRASQQSAPKEVRDQCHAFWYLLHQIFGQTIIKAIALQRQSGSYGLTFPGDPDVNQIIMHFMSNTLVALLKILRALYTVQWTLLLIQTLWRMMPFFRWFAIGSSPCHSLELFYSC
jgi:hypothetical protein